VGRPEADAAPRAGTGWATSTLRCTRSPQAKSQVRRGPARTSPPETTTSTRSAAASTPATVGSGDPQTANQNAAALMPRSWRHEQKGVVLARDGALR